MRILEVLWPKVFQLEQVAEKPLRVLGDDDHVRLGDTLLIGPDDLAQVLRVHAGGEGCRTDKVREHDRDLTTLGSIMRCDGRRSRSGRLWRAFLDTI
jgi:hypothetical protein